MYLIIYILFLCLVGNTAEQHSVNRVNYGIFYKYLKSLKITTATWRTSFIIELPALDEAHANLSNPTYLMETYPEPEPYKDDIKHRPQPWKQYTIDMKLFNTIHLQGIQHLEVLKVALRDILPEYYIEEEDAKRRKKGIGTFIGSIFSGMFDLASKQDLAILEAHVAEAVGNQNTQIQATKRLSNDLTSFVQVTNDKFDQITTAIQNNAESTVKLMDLVATNTNTLIRYYNNMAMTTIQLLHVVQSMTSYLNELLSACETLVSGTLPSFLVNGQMLSKTLDDIQKELDKNAKGQELVHKSPHYYYRHGNYCFIRRGNKLVITMKFPITSINDYFDLYQVTSLPLDLPGQPSNFLQLSTTPGIAIHQGLAYFFNLSSEQLQDEIIVHDNVPKNILHDNIEQSCIMNIFKNNQKKITELCNYEIHTNALEPMIKHLDDNQYYLFHIDQYTLQCDQQLIKKDGCTACIVNLPTGCALHYDDIYIPASYANSTSSSVSHVVNAILLAAFFQNETEKYIKGDTKFPDPPDISIPTFEYLNHTKQMLAGHDKVSIDFKKTVDTVKNSNVIIRNLPDALTLSQVAIAKDYSFWQTNAGWTLMAMIVIIAMLVLNCCYLLYRLRMITILVLILQKSITKTTAMSTTSLPQNIFVYPTNPKVDEEPHIHHQVIEWSSKNGIYLLLILLLAWIIAQIFIYIYRQICRHIRLDNQTHLAMEIHHERKSVTIILQSFNGRPDKYALLMPNQTPILHVEDFCTPTLRAKWYGATVIDDDSTQHYPFPPIIRAPLFTSFMLRYILRRQYQINIFWQYNNQNYHIPYAPPPSSTPAAAPRQQPRQPRPQPRATPVDEIVMTPDQRRQPRQPRPQPRTTLAVDETVMTPPSCRDSSLIGN